MTNAPLNTIITNIYVLYQTLNQLADTKTEVLKSNDIKQLDAIMQKEEILLKKVMKCLEERELFLSQHQNISEFDKQEVEKTSAKLNEELIALTVKNELNQSLIKQSLYYINTQLNVLTTPSQPDTYSPQKQKSSMKPHRVFMDSKV